MARRTTTSGRRDTRARHRPPLTGRRPSLYLGVAAAGAVLVNVLVGTEPAAHAEAGTSEPVSVAEQLGVSAQSRPADPAQDIQPLEQLAASRSTRESEQTAAQQTQAAADQAELARQQAAAEATAAAAAAAAASAAAAEQAGAATAPAGSIAVSTIAHITNSAGPVKPQVQAAADAVVSNVPGADRITLGGTRASATDPNGHPSGRALDYMVGSNTALGAAIAAYQIAHWDELGVEYVIWQQRILSSPGGAWQAMEDRGSPTENHMDHVHVNYR